MPRYRCVHDGRVREVFARDTIRLVRLEWLTTRRCAGFVLRRLAVDKATVAAVARELGRCWDTVNQIAVATTSELLLTAGPARLERVPVLGVDEHRWAYKNAATEALPDAVTVVDPFHVVALCGEKLDRCRQREQHTTGHRGRTGDPLYRVRRTLRTRLELLTDKQRTKLEAVFATEEHAAVEVTWWVYQQILAAYADHDPARGEALLTAVIDRLRSGLPPGLEELATVGRTLHRRRDDVLAYFAHRASDGPTEAINGRLEALRRNALGFHNLIDYRIRSLLHSGNFAL